jgi:hypothetical protein
MIFFNVLSPKQTLLGPEVPVGGMLVPFDQQQGWGGNALRMYKIPGCGYGFFIAALNTILRNSFQNSTAF